MPIPKPNEGEDESQFVSRCISKIIGEYDQTQAAAICYNSYRKKEEMAKKESIFILQPKKTENRGKYLSRCSSHPKMREQYSNLKERLGFCLNCFNEYYKYWNRLDFAGVPEDSALGLCIAEEKSKGFDYKEAYSRCASKVVAQPGPVVMGDELIIEPVAFAECPDATQDVETNLKNRQEAIDKADYGPLNPNEPNEGYWKKKAATFGGDVSAAKKALCGNCSFFIQTKEMLDCIAQGINDTNEWDTIKAGGLGYCEAFDFKCAAERTCSAWVVGGPITDTNS
jgi:hypothetical protein